MYAEALLFRQLNAQLWQARGLVNALIMPWLAIAIARNRNWRMNLYVSRHVVFHTVTLMGAGLYLLCHGGNRLLHQVPRRQLGRRAAGGLPRRCRRCCWLTLLFSANLRARLRVYLSKHFFSYRYDYREEWLRFTEGLAALDEQQFRPGHHPGHGADQP
jgi:hypothetical protein